MIANAFKAKLPALFLLGGLAQIILLPVVHLVMRHVASDKEVADQSVFLALLISTGGLLVYASLRAKKIEQALNTTAEFWIGQIFLLILLFSAEALWPPWDLVSWTGYGPKIAMLSLILTPVLIHLFYKNNAKLDLGLSIVTYGFVLIFYLPAVFQPPWGVVDWFNSSYVVNELLAPQSGRYPLVNFMAQYTSVLGYLFNFLFRSHGTTDQAIWLLTSLAIITMVIALLPLLRAFPKGKRYLAILFSVPGIFIVKMNEGSMSGPISALFSALPARLIFPAIIALLLSTVLFQTRKTGSIILLGLMCSVGIFNNFESGVVSSIAALFVVVLFNRPQNSVYRVVLFVASIIVFGVLAGLTLQSAYGGFKLQTLTAIAGGFSRGHGSNPMPPFGLWVFVFIFLSLSVITGALYMRTSKTDNNHINGSDSNRAAIIALFWGLFGIGMAPYYIHRSVVGGQLQFILIACFLANTGLFLLVARFFERAEYRNMVLIIAMLPCAISTASLVQHPSLDLAIGRLKKTDILFSDQYQSHIIESKQIIRDIKKTYGSHAIGLFTDYSASFSGPLLVSSYLPVNRLGDLDVVTDSFSTEICVSLEQDKNEFLIATVMLPEKADKILRNCGYAIVNALSANSPVTLQVYGQKEILSQGYGLEVMQK